MDYTIEDKVLVKIKKAKRGSVFFVDDFIAFGTASACNKSLERLVTKGELMRVARGVYTLPRYSKLLGKNLTPTTEVIAQAIARRDRALIIPTGSFALNALGLSTQVPMNVVYLTNGSARKIVLNGKRSITFKKTAPKNLVAIGEISKIVIQALKEIGKGKATPEELDKIINLLKKEKIERLEHDIRIAPEWIRNIMKQALPSKK